MLSVIQSRILADFLFRNQHASDICNAQAPYTLHHTDKDYQISDSTNRVICTMSKNPFLINIALGVADIYLVREVYEIYPHL